MFYDGCVHVGQIATLINLNPVTVPETSDFHSVLIRPVELEDIIVICCTPHSSFNVSESEEKPPTGKTSRHTTTTSILGCNTVFCIIISSLVKTEPETLKLVYDTLCHELLFIIIVHN
jgi:hypothetical protein